MINPLLAGLLLAMAVVVLGWGFERYRTRFKKTDLVIAVAFATGILLIVFVPGIYDRIGDVLSLQSRFVVISLFANLALMLFVLYLATGLRETRRKVTEMNRQLSVKQAPRTDGGEDIIQPVIPAYNEGKVIADVVASLSETLFGRPVKPLVVSDGSSDDTARRAKVNGAIVVEHAVNEGQGGALQTGFEIARQNGAEVVVTMDGDGQHPAEELERLVRPIIEDEADFVMGSRYKGTDYTNNSWVRRAGIRTFTWIINFLTKANVTDCTNGYRAIRGSALEEMTLTEEQFSAPELIIEAQKNGLRMEEIPIRIEEREAGETKKPRLGYAFGLARVILGTWIR